MNRSRRNACIAATTLAGALAPAATPAGAAFRKRAIGPTDGAWAQANEVRGAQRWLFVSGQIPEDAYGKVPESFKAQARLTWDNVVAQLRAADMDLSNLVKFTMFLSDRRYRREAYEVRAEVFGTKVVPAMTIVIAGIYDEQWLLEIEAIAAA